MTKSRGILRPRGRWTESELQLLTRNYADSRTEDLATVLEREIAYVYAKATKLGLKKSEAYLASPDACRLRRGDEIGKAFRFDKGHVPANKGLRRPGWHAGRMKSTQFTTGSKPKTWKPIDSLRVNGDGYLDRKVTDTGYPPRDWVPLHRLVWMAANGPIPPGHVVVFKPGRRTAVEADITLDAVELLSRRELMARNTVHNLPKEIVQLVQLRGAVNRQINQRVKNHEQRTEQRHEDDQRPARSSVRNARRAA